MNTVFGHLALQFTTHPENLATEALAFILNNSMPASRAFSAFLRVGGIDCEESLRFETQRVGADGSRPDIKCIDPSGELTIVVENKFWAGLTDNQPVTYLREFSDSACGVVLFVVPEARISLVWNEILDRSSAAGLGVGTPSTHPSITVANTNRGHSLAITSWKSLLSALALAATSPEDIGTRSDIAQLQGLCNAMDEQAFLPLRGEELTDLEIPRRVINYIELSLNIASAAESRGYCSRKGLRETAFRFGSGTYIKIGKYVAWLGYHSVEWQLFGSSPIWVNFYPSPSTPAAEIREKLSRFRIATPQRCFDYKDSISSGFNSVAVPIFLTAGKEKSFLVDNGVSQLRELIAELGVESQVLLSETVPVGVENEG